MRLERMNSVGNLTDELGYGGGKEDDVGEEGRGRTVIVGVRLDSLSRELLTWALVKVAQTGDRVIALHVLKNSVAGMSFGSFVTFVDFGVLV